MVLTGNWLDPLGGGGGADDAAAPVGSAPGAAVLPNIWQLPQLVMQPLLMLQCSAVAPQKP